MRDLKLEKQITLISEAMKQIELTARSMVKNSEDYMAICSALMAVTRNMYLETLSCQETAEIFDAVAESIFITEEMIHGFKNGHKPTLH
tara:strand:- start:1255 stop:1521 length:267 start_codon:yes stop_codon:yes gene_type:complete